MVSKFKPPSAKKIPKTLTVHNYIRTDNYYWLNNREDPQVLKYLAAENKYLSDSLAHTEGLQKSLYKEIVDRIKPDDESVPYLDYGYFYYRRYEKDKEYPLYCRKKGSLKAPEEIILDVNVIAKKHDYCDVRGINISEDNQWLAFGVDTISRRIYTIYIKNLSTGKLLTQKLKNTTGGSVWANDNKTLFYTIKDKTLRPYKIMRHKRDTNAHNDIEVFHESDPTFYCYTTKSKSKKYIYINSESTRSTEVRYVEANLPENKFRIFQTRKKDHEYYVTHHQKHFFILTNLKAKNFLIARTTLTETTRDKWKTFVKHRKNVFIEHLIVFKNHLVIQERKNGLHQLHIWDLKEKSDHYITFKEKAYSTFISVNRIFNSPVLRFGYTSLNTPLSIYDYNMNSHTRKLLKQQQVMGNFDSQNYKTERITAIASDGIAIPVSLVYKKGLDKTAKNPLLLYGYGSYGISLNPEFSPVRLSLLDRGFIYAIAHIRGGQEMGRWWYEEGKLLKKKNTFTDFICCAEELIRLNYTEPKKLFAMGRSAGGLLMGAVLNMRPDLWKGVVAAVPFVDIMTTMLDESIPLTTGEFDEWGNPRLKEYYDYILSYSPYDNVTRKDYPAVLVTAGLHDSQVQYWEPAKWVAKLREIKTNSNPLFLYTEMKAGHSGTTGRFEQYKTTALIYAFILDLLNISK